MHFVSYVFHEYIVLYRVLKCLVVSGATGVFLFVYFLLEKLGRSGLLTTFKIYR